MNMRTIADTDHAQAVAVHTIASKPVSVLLLQHSQQQLLLSMRRTVMRSERRWAGAAAGHEASLDVGVTVLVTSLAVAEAEGVKLLQWQRPVPALRRLLVL